MKKYSSAVLALILTSTCMTASAATQEISKKAYAASVTRQYICHDICNVYNLSKGRMRYEPNCPLLAGLVYLYPVTVAYIWAG